MFLVNALIYPIFRRIFSSPIMSKLVNGDKTFWIFEGTCDPLPYESGIAYDLFVELGMTTNPDQSAIKKMLLPVIRQSESAVRIHNLLDATKAFGPISQRMNSLKDLLDETQSYNSTVRSRLRHSLEEILHELGNIFHQKEAYDGRHKVIILRRLNAISKIIRQVHAEIQTIKKNALEKELYKAFFIYESVLKSLQAQFIIKRFLKHDMINLVLCTKPGYAKPVIEDLINHFGFESIFPV